jgi:hypothetical protein
MDEIMNQQRRLEADTSNASVNQSPQSKIFHVSSPDNQDIDREVPSPAPRSENKELAVDNSGLTPASPENVTITNSPGSDTCKMEKIVSPQKVPKAVASNSSDYHSPKSKVSPVSSPNDKDLECNCPSSSPRSENKVPATDNSILTSAAPENLTTTSEPASGTCKMEGFVNQQKSLEVDASNNNKDLECECPDPSPRSENKVPATDNSLLTSAAPENLTVTSEPASGTCKMEGFVNQQKTLEVDASNNNKDLESECPCSPPRSENKVPATDNSLLTSAAPENLTVTSEPASDTCKMEGFVNQQKTLEVDASNIRKDLECECPSSSPRSENKVPAADNSLLRSAALENLTAASQPASSTCKMEGFMNQHKTLDRDASNNNKDLECECPSSSPSSENKVPALDNSLLTSAAPENLSATSVPATGTCKVDFVNQHKILDTDASNAPVHQPLVDNSLLTSTAPEDLTIASASASETLEMEFVNQRNAIETDASNAPLNQPHPKSDSKDPLVDKSVLTSAGPENLTCKVGEILNKERTPEADVSNVSLNQPPNSSFSCPDNQDMECENPSLTPRSESEQPLMDNSGSTSIVPENLTSASTPDICRMEKILNDKRTVEANLSNGSVIESPQPKVFPVSSPDVQDVECEFRSTSPKPEIKELDVVSYVLTSAASDSLTKQHMDSPDAFVSLKSDPPTGGLGAMKSDFKCEETIKKELYCQSESTVVTRGNMLIDLSYGAESIDVSDVLESLMEEQRCGTSYMQGTTDLEDFLATSVEEEPQCSSPIALSPWGEPSYYQGDAVDSALWGVHDDSINNMWSLLSPRPTLQSSSG